MINLKVGDIDCQLPSEWNEIKLKDYSKIYSIIKSDSFAEPDEDAPPRSEADNKLLETQRGLHNVKLNRKLFSELTGIEQSIINNVDAKEMANTLTLMTNFLNGDVDKMAVDEGVTRSFVYNEKTYFYPIAEMKTSTFGDFIEAAQLDMLAEKDEAGKFGVIAEQMAILCRERGEDYDEQKVIKKTKLFENLTMEKVWGFVFFLNKQISIYKKNIQTFSNQEIEMTTDIPPIIGAS